MSPPHGAQCTCGDLTPTLPLWIGQGVMLKYNPTKAHREVLSEQISAELYGYYSRTLRNAVRKGYNGDSALFEANVSRFAAYKAYSAGMMAKQTVTDKNTGEIIPQAEVAQAAVDAHRHWLATEQNTAITRARSAKQWEKFPEDVNLEWLPSLANEPRPLHIPFYHLVLPKSHPFWQQNMPGQLWNCQCDLTETDAPASNKVPGTAEPPRGLEGNPALTGEIFTDRASYIAKAGTNKATVEKKCENLFRNETVIKNQNLIGKTTTCNIDGKENEVKFFERGIKEYAQSMFGDEDMFWLKNEVLKDMQEYIKKAEYKGYKEVDLSHNTKKATINFKKQLDYYFYFESVLPNKQRFCIHLCRFKKNKEYKLYTVTKKVPENIKTEIVQ